MKNGSSTIACICRSLFCIVITTQRKNIFASRGLRVTKIDLTKNGNVVSKLPATLMYTTVFQEHCNFSRKYKTRIAYDNNKKSLIPQFDK